MLSTTLFPGRYVQGVGALAAIVPEARRLGTRPLAVIDNAIRPAVAARLAAEVHIEPFGGECSDAEIRRLGVLGVSFGCNVVIGIGGGRAVDTAKAVAHGLGRPVIVVPTIASTDAPCSALAVIHQAGNDAPPRYLQLARNPDVVLVDTALIVCAPVRYLVAGMGDALATRFEAEDCRASGAANASGRPGSATAHSIARLCHETLLEYGGPAREAAARGEVSDAFEHVVEANILLSGIGFESGGLSGAHAMHNGLLTLAGTRKSLHGEIVAFCTLALLFLTRRNENVIEETFRFCEAMGLPTTLAQIGLAAGDKSLLLAARTACAKGGPMENVPREVAPEDVVAALREADAAGRARG